jgi:hypothetical protein
VRDSLPRIGRTLPSWPTPLRLGPQSLQRQHCRIIYRKLNASYGVRVQFKQIEAFKVIFQYSVLLLRRNRLRDLGVNKLQNRIHSYIDVTGLSKSRMAQRVKHL